MAGPIASPLVRTKLRPGIKENLCSWVQLPDGKRYLIPIVARQQRIYPVVTGGRVSLVSVESTDEGLTAMVDDFLMICKDIKGHQLSLGEDAIVKLLDLVARLILTNYDFSDEEITKLLTFGNDQIAQLIDIIQAHISRK